MAEKQKVGEVFTYFSNVGVAGIKIISGFLSVGDTISIEGHTTNFTQRIESMEVDRKQVERAEPGQEIGIRVKEKVRGGDSVYKIL